MVERSRAASSVVATILLAAVVVILGATVTLFTLGVADQLRDPAPFVGESTGELVEQDGFDGGLVRIEHVAGDDVAVQEMEVAIDATDACGRRERLIDLPETGTAGRFSDGNVATGSIDSSIVSGDNRNDLGVLDSRTSNTFDAGSFLAFRLEAGECPLSDGDRLVVRVVHAPSNSVIVREKLVV